MFLPSKLCQFNKKQLTKPKDDTYTLRKNPELHSCGMWSYWRARVSSKGPDLLIGKFFFSFFFALGVKRSLKYMSSNILLVNNPTPATLRGKLGKVFTSWTIFFQKVVVSNSETNSKRTLFWPDIAQNDFTPVRFLIPLEVYWDVKAFKWIKFKLVFWEFNQGS